VPEQGRANVPLYGFKEYRYLRWEPDTKHYVVDGLAKLEKLSALSKLGYARGEDDLLLVVFTNADILSVVQKLAPFANGTCYRTACKHRQFAAVVFWWKFKREASSLTQRRGRAVEGIDQREGKNATKRGD
jgi:hypothetical protein